MKKLLFNTAHPLSESGKPIFIPFGEWNYDGKSRQRLDRAHGEAIANELNARVAKGDPGIPVYQGHPDVPELAAKYPDKGALGWVTHIELVNEGLIGSTPQTSQTSQTSQTFTGGLALTVEWDRDPGKGFRWFSPYWLANERDGSTYIVGTIASIGLVNNPNIPEFRLANEEQPTMKIKLNHAIIELAAKYDRLANSVDANGMEHVEAGVPEGGQFVGKQGVTPKGKTFSEHASDIKSAVRRGNMYAGRIHSAEEFNNLLTQLRRNLHSAAVDRKHPSADYAAQARTHFRQNHEMLKAIHKQAILRGYSYDPKKGYSETPRSNMHEQAARNRREWFGIKDGVRTVGNLK